MCTAGDTNEEREVRLKHGMALKSMLLGGSFIAAVRTRSSGRRIPIGMNAWQDKAKAAKEEEDEEGQQQPVASDIV